MKTQESDLIDGKRLKSWLMSEGAYVDSLDIVAAINNSKFHAFGIHLRRNTSDQISTLKKGDKVVMHSCMESDNPKNAGRIWTCKSDAFRPRGHNYCSIFLENFGGSFSTEFLQKVNISEFKDESPELRESLKWFAGKMEETLQQNDSKGGWRDCSLKWLMMRLREETNELEGSFAPHHPFAITITEAADVANFAMMIADNSRNGGINHEVF